MAAKGRLRVRTTKGDSFIPVDKTKITVIQNSKETVLQSDSSGLTEEIELEAPPIEYSMNPSNNIPYSFCDIRVESQSFREVLINKCQIYPDTLAIQDIRLNDTGSRQGEIINVEPNTLVGDFAPKIPEDPEKPLPSSGLVVLQGPVVPQFIVVHTGTPDNNAAPNYTVRYRDYIKNVASCEIFSTWKESTIRANIYCIISFTLNRIYTEWYRGKGKNFDITNSTAFDHAFNYGRNVYSNISRIVDDIFTNYLKRPGAKQPLLTQYCDGTKVQCPGWLTQWGSKYLGDEGKAPFEILTNFYGNDLQIVTAEKVKGIPMSYPGYALSIGTSGMPVRTVQNYLNRISQNYPAIPKVSVDGMYGQGTFEAVKTFQRIFDLPQTGVVNYPTWYKISDIYVAVTKIAELRDYSNKNYDEFLFSPPKPCGYGITNTPIIKIPYRK